MSSDEKRLSFTHRFVTGSARKTVLLLHGTGADENDLVPLGRELAPEANLLSPRGKVLENGMTRFFRRLAPGVFDVDDLKARTTELRDFVSEAVSAYGLDGREITALGYSNGANIAASLLLMHPGSLRGAALLRAQIPFEPEHIPQLDGTSVFVAAGRFDQMVPSAETERLIKLLEQAGADVTAFWEDAGHEFTQKGYDATRDWISSHLV